MYHFLINGDGPTRKDGRTASDVFLTPCPPYARKNANGGSFQVPEGAETMTTNTPIKGTIRATKPSPTHTNRKPWPFIASGMVLTDAQRLRAAARHATRAAALLEQIGGAV